MKRERLDKIKKGEGREKIKAVYEKGKYRKGKSLEMEKEMRHVDKDMGSKVREGDGGKETV